MKDEPDDVSVRVVDPAGWPWTVRRRWLPWRPHFVTTLMLPVVLIEGMLLIALLPFAVLAHLLGWRWTVEAHGRRGDGTRVRYETRAGWRASGRLRDTAAAEIRETGAPTSLGAPIAVPFLVDATSVACLVQGYGTATSRDGWVSGSLTAGPGMLSLRTDGGPTWPLLGSDTPVLTLAGPADRAAVGMRVIASYPTPVGQFRVAVDPHLGPLLADLLAEGATDNASSAWTMWRQDAAGAVREIARFGSRADAELLAENLAARGSRQRFWLAAARH